MEKLSNMQLAITFARRRINEGLTFDEVSERTALYMYQQLNCSVIEAQTASLRAAAIVDAELSSLYFDMSRSTSDTAVISDPSSGQRQHISLHVVNHALRCLARSNLNTAAATA